MPQCLKFTAILSYTWKGQKCGGLGIFFRIAKTRDMFLKFSKVLFLTKMGGILLFHFPNADHALRGNQIEKWFTRGSVTFHAFTLSKSRKAANLSTTLFIARTSSSRWPGEIRARLGILKRTARTAKGDLQPSSRLCVEGEALKQRSSFLHFT